jgi:hypothetical protein
VSTAEPSGAATFARARRRRVYRRPADGIRRTKSSDLLALDETMRRLRPFVPAHIAMLDRAFPGATEADLFLHVWTHGRELIPDCGCGPLQHAAREAVRDRRGRRRFVLLQR